MKQEIKSEIMAEMNKLLFKNSNIANIANIIFSSLLFILLQDKVDKQILIFWLNYIFFFNFLAVFIAYLGRKKINEIDKLNFYGHVYFIFTIMNCLGWAVSSFILYIEAFLIYQLYLFIVILSVISLAMLLIAPVRRLYLTIVFLTALSFLVRLVLEDDQTHDILGILFLIFLLISMRGALRLNARLKESFRELSDLKREKRQDSYGEA